MLIREVQISDGGTGVVGLPLHPQITIVAGLDPAEQVELADLVASVIYGRTEGLGGSVEVGGELVHVEAWAEMVGEALDAIDVFVRPEDVPHAPSMFGREVESGDTGDRARQLLIAIETAREQLVTAERTLAEAESTEYRARVALEDAQRQPDLSEDVTGPEDPPSMQSPTGHAEDEDSAQSGNSTQPDLASLRLALTSAEAGLEASRAAERMAGAAMEGQRTIEETLRAELDSATADLTAATAECEVIAAELEEIRSQWAAAQSAAEAERSALVLAHASVQAEAQATAAAQAAVERDAARRAEAVRRADVAAAAADDASCELGRAATATEEAALALDSVAAAPGSVGADSDELARLDRRAEQLGEDLARARAEESLFAGLATTQEGDLGQQTIPRGRGRKASVAGRASSAPDDALAAAEAEARTATARAASLRTDMDVLLGVGRPSTLRGGELVERRRAAADRLQQIRHEIDALRAAPDLGALSAAVARLVAIPADDQIQGSEELLTALDTLIASRAAANLGSAPRWLVEAARTGLEEARIELARAEEMYRPMRVSPEDVAALESAHAAIEAVESKAEKRIGGALARRRLEKATADERELLVRLGLPSYATFVFRTMPMANGSEAAVHLEVARRAMADAEAVWEELHQGAAAADTADTEEAEARVLARAAAIVGAEAMGRADTSNPAATLRSVRALLAEALASVADRSGAERDLAEIMDGIDGLESDGSNVLGDAVRWLECHDADGRRRAALHAEMAQIADDLEQAQRSIDQLEQAAPPDVEVRAALERDLEHAEREAAAARERLHQAAVASGVAPAAAADAADPALLLVGTGPPAGESGEALWAHRSSVEVEVSRRDIAAIEEEVADLAARREVLGGGTRHAQSPDLVAGLVAALQTAEAQLAEAQRAADAAIAAKEEALQALDGFDPTETGTTPNSGAAVEEERRISERLAEAQDLVEATASQIASAEDRLAIASADVTAKREDLTLLDERYREAVLSLNGGAEAFRGAMQLTSDLEAQVVAARSGLERAEATVQAAAARSEARRLAAEESAARALQRDRAQQEARVALEDAQAAHIRARELLVVAQSQVEIARTALSSTEQAPASRNPGTPSSRGDPTGTPEHQGDGGEAEIYMLSRLATARSMGVFGAVPLILLDPFVDLPLDERAPVHELLVRMGPFVQMIYVTADPSIARWGTDLGPERATVLHFGEPVLSG